MEHTKNTGIVKTMKLCSFLFSFLIAGFCGAQKQFVLKAKLDGANNVPFILEYREVGGYATIDTATSVDGKFIMKGTVEKPAWVHLISKNTGRRLQFYLENSEIEITGDINTIEDAKIRGSKTQDQFIAFVTSGDELKKQYTIINNGYLQALDAKDLPKVIELEKEGKHILDEQKRLLKNFIEKNPDSYAAPAVIRSFMTNLDAQELQYIMSVLDTSVANYPLLKPVYERINVLNSVAVGKKAPVVAANDIQGNQVSLSSKIGSRLLLVYFWATWSPRSELEFNNLSILYNQYKNKGFEIVGISLDYRKQAWEKSVKDNNLQWTNISDLAYTGSMPAIKFGVASLPASFLLDEQGVIIAKDLWGEELSKKLKQVFGDIKDY